MAVAEGPYGPAAVGTTPAGRRRDRGRRRRDAAGPPAPRARRRRDRGCWSRTRCRTALRPCSSRRAATRSPASTRGSGSGGRARPASSDDAARPAGRAGASSGWTAGCRRRSRSWAPTSRDACGRPACWPRTPISSLRPIVRSWTRARRSSSARATRRRTRSWPRACRVARRARGARGGVGRAATERCWPAGRSTRATTRCPTGGTSGGCGCCSSASPDCIAIETQTARR